VLDELKELHSDLWLLIARLSSLHAQLYGNVPALLTALRKQQGTNASEQLASDLQWAWRAAPALRALPDPKADAKPWLDLIANKQGWTKALNTVEASYSRYKLPLPVYISEGEEVPDGCLVCELCPTDARRVYATHQAIAVHMSKTLGVICPEKAFINGNCTKNTLGAFTSFTCPVCSKIFMTPKSAYEHISMSKTKFLKCAAVLCSTGQIVRA
jgi:hypothetical protein